MCVIRAGIKKRGSESDNKLYLETECGINRVAIRSTLKPGTVTLTAMCSDLEPAMVQILSHPVKIESRLAPIEWRLTNDKTPA